MGNEIEENQPTSSEKRNNFRIFLWLSLILAFCLLGWGKGSWAADFYIAQNQAGANDGSSCINAHAATWFNTSSNWANPKQTGKIGPGDTVHLCSTISSALTIQASGAPNNPITVLFDPNAKMSAPTWPDAALYSWQHDYLIIDGGQNGVIEATDSGSNLQRIASVGINFQYSSYSEIKNLHIRNMYIHRTMDDTSGAGAGIAITGSNNLIHDNSIEEVGYGITYTYAGSSLTKDLRIYSNYIYHTAVGINFGSGYINALADNIQIYSNDIGDMNVWDDSLDVFHHDGIHVFAVHDGANITNLKIYNNYFHGDPGIHATAYIYPEGTLDSPLIFNNLIVDLSQNSPACGFIYVKGPINAKILNNTFVGSGGNLGIIVDGPTPGNKNLQIMNNIFCDLGFPIYHEPSVADQNISQSNYNSYFNSKGITMSYGAYGGSIEAWRSSGYELNSLFLDPQFLSTDYHLSPNSPAINKGLDLSNYYNFDKGGISRPQGLAWDIGAYEYVPGGDTGAPAPPTGLSVN